MNRGSLQFVLEFCGALNEEVLRSIAQQSLMGLYHLHLAKKVHRDIKPGNILLNHKGEVKIGDFGIVGQLDHTLAMHQTFVGTTIYMSPERITSEHYSYPADIWSLGLSLFTLGTGQFPYATIHGYWGLVHALTQQPPPRLPTGPPSPGTEPFSADFRDFIDRCLVKDPLHRWSAAQLLGHPWLLSTPSPAQLLENNAWPSELDMLGPTQSILSRNELAENALQASQV